MRLSIHLLFTAMLYAVMNPYLTEHINRFGDHTLNLDRKLPQPNYILGQAASAC